MRSLRPLAVLLGALALPTPSAAGESPYGDAYTAAEMAALDRALHAVNMDRTDLTFRKDMAEGHGCFESVRWMLRDPLLIAPAADRMAERLAGGGRGGVLSLARAAFLPEEAEPSRDGAPDGPRTRIRASDPEELLDALEALLARQPSLGLPAPAEEGAPAVDRLLRHVLPPLVGDHDVYESPFPEEERAAIDAWLEERPKALAHELAASVDVPGLLEAVRALPFHSAAREFPPELFPQDRPLVRETPHGRIALGTAGDDLYEGEYAALVDPGGDDRYAGARIGTAFGTEGRRVGFFADLGGDDVYECSNVDVNLGAAVLGIAVFLDLGAGNDRYEGGHFCLGAAAGGVAFFYDDGGSDTYEAKTFAQGAAGFGVGAFLDDAVQAPPVVSTDEGTKDPVAVGRFDNDRLGAWANAQGFARPRGVAICWNRRGNDVYQAGGVYLHAPLFADRYQSFSQGFAIGSREVDWAGGIALLADVEGNDRYLGDIYDQGVGYWYSAGLLWDGGGNDLYEMTQYGQGSGIHLAVGGLVDVAGHDTYVMHSGLGQGGSHDYAASVLHDRGGNDRYHGNTSCNGCGLTNSVGLHLDRSGDDTYAGRRGGSLNAGRPARGFGSIGVLVDLGGADDYLSDAKGPMEDGATWRQADVGVGVDVADAPDAAAGPSSAPNQVTGQAKVPEVVHHEGPLTPEVFDALWEIATRWEVGDNRYIVPEARKRLVAFGPEILPLLDAKVEVDHSGLELRAYVDVLKGLSDGGAEEGVLDLLRRNLAAEPVRRRRVALHLVGELGAKDLEGEVVATVEGADEAMALRAAGVLLRLESHAGDARLRTWLDRDGDERRIGAALSVLLGLATDAYADVRPLLDHPLMPVRSRLATLLSEKAGTYGARVLADLGAEDLSDRARRTLLDAVARGGFVPDAAAVAVLARLVEHTDFGLRADAARAVRSLASAKDADRALLASAVEALDRRLATEEDPFVRAAASPAAGTAAR